MPGLQQVLLELGLDLGPLEAAQSAIQDILLKVNALADENLDKSTKVADSQKQSYAQAKQGVDDLIRGATAQIALSDARKAQLEAETAELRKQYQEMRNLHDEETKRVETSEGFLAKLTKALTGGTGGTVAAAFIGGGIGAGLEAATEGIVKFVEKLKEGVIESSKLASAMDTFEKSARGQNIDPGSFIHRLQTASDGLVNKLDLAVLGTRLLNSGIQGLSPDKVIDVTQATIRLAEASNHSAADAVRAMTSTLTRGSGRNVSMLASVTGLPAASLQVANLSPGLNMAQRSAEQISHAFAVIIAQAQKLGDGPQTLEQALMRIKVLSQDVMLSFGKGFTESGGMQLFFSMLKGGAADVTRLEDKFEDFGHVVGNVFATLTVVVHSVWDAFVALLHVIGELVQISLKLLGISDSMDRTSKSADNAADSITGWKKALLDVSLAFIDISAKTQHLAGQLTDLLAIIKSVIDAIPLRALVVTAGAVKGGTIGGLIGGPEVGILSAFAGGMAAGKAYDIVARETAKPGGTPDSASSTQHVGTDKRTLDLANQILAGSAASRDEKIDAEAARLRQQATDMLTAKPRVGKGTYTGPGIPDEETLRQQSQRVKAQENYDRTMAAAEDALQKSADAVERARAAEAYKAKIADIEVSKQAALDAYKAQEVSLATHLDVMRALENSAYDAHREENARQEKAQLADLNAARTKVMADYQAKMTATAAEGRLMKTPKDTLALQFRTLNDALPLQLEAIDNASKAAVDSYNGSEASLRREHLKTMGGFDLQATADSVKALKTANEGRIKILEEGIKEEESLLKHQYQQLLVPAEDYYRQLDALAVRSRDAQIGAAAAAYVPTKEGLAKLLNAVGAANAQLNASRQAQGLARPEDVEKRAEAAFGRSETGLSRTLTMAQKFPGLEGTSTPERVMTEQASLFAEELRRTQQAMQDEATARGTNTLAYIEMALHLQDVNQKLAETAVALQKMHDPTVNVVSILGGMAGLTASVFTSKFATNLTQNIQSGAKQFMDAWGPGGMAAKAHRGLFGGGMGYDEESDTYFKAPSSKTEKAAALVSIAGQLGGAAQTIANAKTTMGGVGGGLMAGASVGADFGPIGAAVGAAVGAVMGGIVGGKQARVTADINRAQTEFKNTMNAFAYNSNNITLAIQAIQTIVQQLQAEQASSKKGSAQYQSLIDKYNDQIIQLTDQQHMILVKMNEQLAILSVPSGAQSYLTTLQQILDQYNQFAGAAANLNDAAKASQFLTESLSGYEQTSVAQLGQDNQQAIEDSLKLNDLLYQRQQMMLTYSQQVQNALGQGSLSRQFTRAQTAGQQIEQLTITYNQQIDQINEQISAAQFRVTAESRIFGLAATRIGLEMQLLGLQNAQTSLDMQRIAALQQVVSQLATGVIDPASPMGQLVAAIPYITNPYASDLSKMLPGVLANGGVGSGSGDLLALLVAGAYQSRGQAGYGAFRGQQIG